MSVFRLQEWWSVKMADDEEFDNGCMVIGNLDNSKPASDKIAVGSLKGVLRIYAPSKPQYRVEDLIYEELLEAPVLQLLMGRFIPSSPDCLGLAVLHPKKLVVYELIPQTASTTGKVTHYLLSKVYQHVLGDADGRHFTAYSMISGCFGGSQKGREMILVQSMDGKLQIFEQSAHAFSRQFADCLLPGPMVYMPHMDAFVHCNYACRVECFRYQMLASLRSEIRNTAAGGNASAAESKEGGDGRMSREREREQRWESSDSSSHASSSGSTTTTTGFGLLSVQSALVEWNVNVGEPVRQVIRGCFSKSHPGTSLTAGDIPSETTFYAKNARNRSLNSPSYLGFDDEILVLCDKTLYLLKETGGIIQQRRLEHDAVCMCAYVPGGASGGDRGSNAGHCMLIASSEGTVQVFRDFVLQWAAKVPTVPVQLAVGSFGVQKGLIVTLDDTGTLTLGYLGTKPPVNAVLMSGSASGAGGSASREMNYDKIDEEHRALLQIIRESQSEKKGEPKDKLMVRIQMPRTLDKDIYTDLLESTGSGIEENLVVLDRGAGGDAHGHVKICVRVYLSFTGDQPATNVTITPHMPNFVHVAPVNVVLEQVAGSAGTPMVVKFYMYALRNQIPSDLNAQFLVTYSTPTGESRVQVYPLALPLFLACRLRQPSKQASFKFALGPDYGTNDNGGGNGILLTELFDDVLYATQESGVDVAGMLGSIGNYALGFEYYYTTAVDSNSNENPAALQEDEAGIGRGRRQSQRHGGGAFGDDHDPASAAPVVASILLSKQTGRYRVQSESLSGILLITAELERRLVDRIQLLNGLGSRGGRGASNSPAPVLITYTEPLPLENYFALIGRHFATRQRLNSLLSDLNDNSHQFRIVQKRLLVRYKDRNAAPLNGLDQLMNDSYQTLLKLSDAVEGEQALLGRQSRLLACYSKLLVVLAGMKFNLSPNDRKLLETYLCPDLRDGSEQGWEECVEAGVTYLLKTCLAKTVKESTSLSNTVLEIPLSTDRLVKHIAMVFDRLAKGARLNVPQAAGPSAGSGGVAGLAAPVPALAGVAASASGGGSSAERK